MKKIAIAVILSTFVAAPAVAADMYAGVRAGTGKASIDNVVLTDDSDTGWGVFGGYAINSNFAVEVEYLDLGEAKDGTDGYDTNGYSISAVGTFPIDSQFSLFGKLGYAMITTEGTGTAAGGPDVDSDDFAYGLGAQYNISPEVGIRLGWDKYKLDDSTLNVKGDISLISVSGLIKF